jgi:hypothetical protein
MTMRSRLLCAFVIGGGLVGGCDALTSVDAPDVIHTSAYATPAGASALAAAAMTQFHSAYGSGDALVAFSGYMSDEFIISAATGNPTTQSNASDWDSRTWVDNRAGGLQYTALHEARQRALTTIRQFQDVAPDSIARIGSLFALRGFVEVLLAEHFCSGVPLSHRDAQLQPVYGLPRTTAQLLDTAILSFDSALVYGVDSIRIVNLARVGRARALLNAGRFADAAQAVTGVPTTFVASLGFVTTTLPNFFFPGTTHYVAGTVPDREGTNGINWITANDPRVPLIRRPPAGTTPELYGFVPYQASNASMRLAGGVEARLIEAEASLQAGNVTAWLATHNALRATVSGLTPLADPGTAAGRVDLHFRERAFWLFLTAHRLGDMRRLIRQYGRNAETVFPTGMWRGRPYGDATSFSIPVLEFNNPHFTGCLSRDP